MHSATNQDLSDQQKILVLLISLLLAFYLFALCTHISRASTAHKKGPLQLNEVHDSRKELRMTVIASLAAMCALLISDKANLADISLIIALTLWTYGDYVFATVQQTK
jgi:cobalamin synthase